MHIGLPVIASDSVGAAAGGLVRENETGFVVPERNVSALADALRRVARDDALVARLGTAGRAHAATYTFDRMADAFSEAVTYARAQHD